MESNYYLLGEAGRAVVIDPNDPKGPLERLEALGWTSGRILLTHEHCDHMAGLEASRNRQPEARVAAIVTRSAGLGDTRLNMTQRMEIYPASRGKSGMSYPPFVCRPADETYEHAWEYVWRGHRLHVMALPGYTPGNTGILLGGNIFFSGDHPIPGEEIILRLPGGNEVDYRAVTKPVLRGLSPGLHVCPGRGESYILKGKE